MKILILSHSHTSPSARFRLLQFVGPLRSLGHEVTVRVIKPERWPSAQKFMRFRERSPSLTANRVRSLARIASAYWNLRDAGKYDVIFMNRDIVPEIRVDFLEPQLAKRNPRLVFDFDDAIHVGSREAKLRKILPYFAWLTAGNEYLASFARAVNENVSIWPTVVDTETYKPSRERIDGPVRIGWSGSRSTLEHCLPLLESVMMTLATQAEFEFVVIADVPPAINWRGVETRFIQWTPQTEVWGLQQIDIGLMPLKDEPRERGKCGLKAIQYMAVAVPALVSPVGVNVDIVSHGETGFHCASSNDWIERLMQLIADASLRRQLGDAAQLRVQRHYSVQSLLPEMLEVFEKVSTS